MREFGFDPVNVAARATALLHRTADRGSPTTGPGSPADPPPHLPRGPPMTALHDLYDQQGQSPWIDNLRRDWLQDGTMAGLVDRGHPRASPPTRPSSPRPSAARTPTTSSSAPSSARPRWRTPTGTWWSTTSRRRWPSCAPSTTRPGGADGFVSVEVAPSLAHDTEGTTAAARALHKRIDQPNVLVKIPATPECVPSIRHHDRRGPQHQRHPHLFAHPLRRGDRGLPLRPRDAGRLGHGRPVRRVERGLVLHQPGRHRGGQADRGGRGRGRRQGSARPAGQGGRGPGPTGLCAVHRVLHRAPVGGPRRPGRPGAAPAVGVDIHQEPGLPGPGLRRHADRPPHGQHHARRHRRRLPRPRHRGPHGGHRPRRRPVDHRPAGGGRYRHGGRGRGAGDRGRRLVRRLVRRSDAVPHRRRRKALADG